jgi:hypothetical protein
MQLEVLEARDLPAGTWTALANQAPSPDGTGTMMLLTDGTVMVQGGGIDPSWYRLTPDASGSYVNGTWSQLASMNAGSWDYTADVLPSGKVFMVGGEFTGTDGLGHEPNTGEIYDPVANSWTSIANFPLAEFGDDSTEVLPDGTILGGSLNGPDTYRYNPATNTWIDAGTKLRDDASSEESWVKLPDGSILSYDIWASINTGTPTAERYVPATDTWVDAGVLPVSLSTYTELGPAFLLPDGRALFFGDNGNTAYYTPSTNTWAAGPVVPDGLSPADVPGAMMPNGHILIAAGTDPHSGGVDAPTTIFDLDPTTNTFTDVTPDSSIIDTSGTDTYDRMLMLPSGQVMLTTLTDQLVVYTPDGAPDPSWQPTISSVVSNGGLTYTLTGTQLNGMSEGAAYGDDAEMATNYPIVQLTDANGTVHDAQTFNWTSMVQSGSTPVSTQFTLPAGLPVGQYSLSVIADGIASAPISFTNGLAVTGSTPTQGSAVASPPTSFTVNFNEPVDPTSLSAAALTVNGVPADGVTLDPTNSTATFTYNTSPVSAEGVQNLEIAAGTISGQDGSANTAFAAAFYYDAVTLGVASATPAAGSVITLPGPGSTVTYDVAYNEPIDPATASPYNLFVSQGTVTAATVQPGNTTVAYTIAGLTDGPLNVSIPASQVLDAADNPFFTPYSASHDVDVSTQPLPAFTAVVPAGSLSYQTSASDAVNFSGDTDKFTLAADPGETLTVLVTAGSAGLQPTVQLSDPSGKTLGTATAKAAGQNVLLQTIATTTSGTYTVTVSGATSTTGAYAVHVYLDSAVEGSSQGIGSDNSRTTAQSLTSAFVSLQTALSSASQASVVGSVGFTPVTLNAIFTGWWDNTGYHDPTNPDYIAGQYDNPPLEKFHDFFVFDLSGITHTIASAQLQVSNPSDGYYSTRSSDTFTLYDDTTALATLEGPGSGTNQASEVAVFNDLGSGTNYGSTTVSSASDGQIVSVNFDSNGVSALNSHRGKQWAVGGALTTASGTHDQAIFSDTGNSPQTEQLLLKFATDTHYYSFALAAGQVVTVGLKNLTGTGDVISIQNSSGTTLARGVAGAANLDQEISNFTAPAAGTYYVVVSDGVTNATYNLTIIRDAAFDAQSNGSVGAAQDLTGTHGVVGSLVSTAADVVPAADASTEAYSSNAYPFAYVSTMRYQQIYDAAEFTGGTIDTISFRRVAWQEPFTSTTMDVSISLGYAATTVLTASDVFADNIGPAGLVNVYNGPLVLASTAPDNTPQAFDIIINLMHDFQYDPTQGDLLLDISVYSSPNNVFFLESTGGEDVDSTTRIYAYDVNEPAGIVGFGGSSTGPYGLVTQFGYAAPPPPAWYAVTLTANQTALAVATSTPLGGSSQPLNALAPSIDLYDSSGNLVAAGSLLADGRNQSLLATGLTPGATYDIEIGSANGSTGEYFLGVTPLITPAVTVTVDDAGPGFTTLGTGWKVVNGSGYDGSEHTHAAVKSGTAYAQWQYSENLTAGTPYAIYASWVAAPGNATNATYKIYDGSTLIATVTENQTRCPNTGLVGSTLVQQLYVYTPTTTGTHTITIQLSDNANGTVVADAVFDPPLAALDPPSAAVPDVPTAGGVLLPQIVPLPAERARLSGTLAFTAALNFSGVASGPPLASAGLTLAGRSAEPLFSAPVLSLGGSPRTAVLAALDSVFSASAPVATSDSDELSPGPWGVATMEDAASAPGTALEADGDQNLPRPQLGGVSELGELLSGESTDPIG